MSFNIIEDKNVTEIVIEGIGRLILDAPASTVKRVPFAVSHFRNSMGEPSAPPLAVAFGLTKANWSVPLWRQESPVTSGLISMLICQTCHQKGKQHE